MSEQTSEGCTRGERGREAGPLDLETDATPLPVSSAAVALIETDRRCRIRSWGEGAVRLFAFRAAQVLGHPLHQILDARDLFGNRACRWACNIQEMVRMGEEIRPFVLHVRTANGLFVRVATKVTVVGASSLLYEFKTDCRRRTRDRRSIDQQTADSLFARPAWS